MKCRRRALSLVYRSVSVTSSCGGQIISQLSVTRLVWYQVLVLAWKMNDFYINTSNMEISPWTQNMQKIIEIMPWNVPGVNSECHLEKQSVQAISPLQTALYSRCWLPHQESLLAILAWSPNTENDLTHICCSTKSKKQQCSAWQCRISPPIPFEPDSN